MLATETLHRLGTLAGVERHEDVTRLTAVIRHDHDPVAEPTKHANPPQGGDSVARARAGCHRCNNKDPHFPSPQVRNPAKTSRRSGR
jgi:hypothetical protein